MPKPILLEVMKARAGIPTNDLFAMLWAQKIRAGSSRVQTLTGIPPLTFNANGTLLISWSMKGNGVQSGTPTPDNPVMPTFCGVRTANLFDISSVIYWTWTNGSGAAQPYGYGARSIDIPSNQITVSFNGSAFPYSYSIVWVDSDGEFIIRNHIGSSTQIKEPQTFTPPSNAAKLYIQMSNGTDSINIITKEQIERYGLMLNLGATALPYEPYGWAEKITCAGQTVPVYLGQTQTVRRVKKLVLTGEELLYDYPGMTGVGIRMNVPDMRIPATQAERIEGYCTHFPPDRSPSSTTTDSITFGVTSSYSIYILLSVESQQLLNVTSISEFKTWIAAQYAAGTPVTVWYVLSEPQTAIVNEPLAKIGDYADELHSTDAGVTIPTAKGQNTLTVDSDLQPSSMTITFK